MEKIILNDSINNTKYNAKVYYNQGGGDEQYTPKYGVEDLY